VKDFWGAVGFGIMVVLIFKGCNAPTEKPLVGINGIYWDTRK
jgi:hypothetical protein